ncbi:MAG: hypothetical protein ACO1SV_18010 [Fimbriimonas sp.]
MTAIARIMAPAMGLFLLLAGCNSSPRFDYKGTWRGKREVKGQPGADPDVLQSIAKVELRVDAMEHFSLFFSPYAMEGNLARTPTGAALPIDTILGKPLDRQPPEVQAQIPRLELFPQEDGTLRMRDPRQPQSEVVLTREAKPGG